MDAYALALEGRLIDATAIGASRTPPGSLSALIAAYYGSGQFQNLKDSTKRTYRASLEPLRKQYGQLSVRNIEKRHVQAIIDKMADRPTAANKLIKRLRTLFDLAIDMEWRDRNPAARVKYYKIKSDGYHLWTEAEIAAFKKAYPSGTRERLALELLLCTGQRRCDVVRMGPGLIGTQEDGTRYMRTYDSKNDQWLKLPILPELETELAKIQSSHMVFLTTEYGKAFSVAGFGNWFNERAKLGTGNQLCSAHGLRKACATRLAEHGATAHEIMAVTGHASLREVERYTKGAKQFPLAESAFARLRTGTDGEQQVSNPDEKLDNSRLKSLK